MHLIISIQKCTFVHQNFKICQTFYIKKQNKKKKKQTNKNKTQTQKQTQNINQHKKGVVIIFLTISFH